MRNYFGEAVTILPSGLKAPLLKLPQEEKEQIQEIRLRCGQPLSVQKYDTCYFVTEAGTLTMKRTGQVTVVSGNQIQYALLRACDDSIHTQQEHIAQGFVTLPGGHRLGLCGTAVTQRDKLVNVRDISALNLRIAREKQDCSLPVLRQLGPRLPSFLLAGPPASGKTTILRDIARQVSSGRFQRPMKVAVVDERGEIAAAYQGVPQNDLGPCTDVLDGYPKSVGISTALRVLSPHVVLCDEIGTMEEVEAVIPGLHSGVVFILSVHAASKAELLRREQIRALLKTGAFAHVVLLGNGSRPGQVEEIYGAGELINEMVRADHDFCGMHGNRSAVEPRLCGQGTYN